jgi:hypothetical protein
MSAALTAASTCSSDNSGIFTITSPVDGLKTDWSRPVPSQNPPAMKLFVCMYESFFEFDFDEGVQTPLLTLFGRPDSW